MGTIWEKTDPGLRLPGALSRLYTPRGAASMRVYGALARKLFRGKTTPLLRCDEEVIDAQGEPLRMCVYRPLAQGARQLPGVLWLHGGGYALGMPEADSACYKTFMLAAPCVIVAPDYTLSTQKPYPAALSDCYDALCWMAKNAQALGIRDDQLFVMGASAGGGLTAALTLLARDRGEVNVAFQMPIYPMIDDRPTASSRDNHAPVWNTKTNRAAWRMYLGSLYGGDVPKYAAPARETDYAGLPPSYTYVGDIEPFYDETMTYIQNLKHAGVPAKVDVYKGCYHGFDAVAPAAPISRQATRAMADAFRHAVKHYFAAQPYRLPCREESK